MNNERRRERNQIEASESVLDAVNDSGKQEDEGWRRWLPYRVELPLAYVLHRLQDNVERCERCIRLKASPSMIDHEAILLKRRADQVRLAYCHPRRIARVWVAPCWWYSLRAWWHGIGVKDPGYGDQ